MKNILDLTTHEAIDFMMQSEQYRTFELPEYYDFDKVLDYVKNTIQNKVYEECISDNSPNEIEDINVDIILNKDGKYAIRPISLVNPFLYYFLVREVFNKDSWNSIKECFTKYKVPNISSCALPLVSDKVETFHKSKTVLHWWNSVEQQSLELSLEYRYMFVTDITNCYGSIDPKTIEMALSRKGTLCETDSNHVLANNIMIYLKAFQRGRNVGIPQGSVLFDFIGEIVLGYSDLLFHESLKKENINDYEIIRYRDDYRIFCNNRDTLEKISYILQHVLESLNLRLNSQKTIISESIVTDSIKSDKLFYIMNTPIFNKKGVDFDGIEKHLLYILMFGRKYPNGGQLKVMLSDLDKRVIEIAKKYKEKAKILVTITHDFNEVEKDTTGEIITIDNPFSKKYYENIRAIAAIGTQIALENVTSVHYVLRVISRIVDSLCKEDEKWDIMMKVRQKLCNRPNSDYDKMWLQNITYQQDKIDNINPYDFRLCKLVMGEKVELWNNTWLKKELIENFSCSSVINSNILSKVTPVITFRETRAYYDSIELLLDEL